MRKVVFRLQSFKSQGTQVGPPRDLPYFLVLCRGGYCWGTQAMCQLMGREVIQILGMRTDRMHLLMTSKTFCAARIRSHGATSQQVKEPPPLLE